MQRRRGIIATMIPIKPDQFLPPKPTFAAVSIVVPAHNESRYIEKTLQQLHKAARQIELDYEIIVVNDDSSDDTVALAKEADATVIDVKLRNIGAVRNAGAARASNPWLFFVDADTHVPAGVLFAALQTLKKGSVGGGAFVALDETADIHWTKMAMYYMVCLIWQTFGRWAAGCFMFCQRSQFEDFGGFDESYYAAEELFFSKQLKRRGKFQLIREPVVTSARKFRSYSTLALLKFALTPITTALKGNPLGSRQGLAVLYEDDR